MTFIVGAEQLSRAELIGAATAVADRIAGLSVVAVEASASMTTIVAVVGGLIAGVPVVPIPPDSGPAERDHFLRDSAAELVLSAADIDLSARSTTVHAEPDPANTALILYTSGTTGVPKGVVLSRAAIAADIDALAEAWAWTANDTLVHGLPLFHVHGLVAGVLGPLRVGSKLIHTVRPTPEAYAAAQGTLYFGVPTVWSRICADPKSAQALKTARLLVSGSAPLPIPVFNKLTELTGQSPVERYGMTETLLTISARADGPRMAGSVGKPLAGVRTRLVSDSGEPVPNDGETVGELQVSSPTLFGGYLNRPDATAESFTADGWFKTGDVAIIDPDGTHRIVGRTSVDLIKTGGYRVGAGEIENALLAHPDIKEAAVIGAPHDDLGQQIVAYVVADGLLETEVIDFVASTLSIHKRPRHVHFVTELPRNHMGKVQKKLLG
jgi:fatty acid CoA ligase FadD36